MKEIKGDFWKEAPNYEALVCTTNKVVIDNRFKVINND